MTLAPIVLFVYNRPWHTKQTVEALQKNEFAKDSELFIYSDEAKNEDARKNVDEVREYIEKIGGFKKVTIIKREKNWGLANSIIDGVTKIVNEYGKIIVLEDDLVTSPYFLKFMNEALDFYKEKKRIWHISGWNYPIDTSGLDDIFLCRVTSSWSWATWADRWQYFEKNVDKYFSSFSTTEIKKFNLDGYRNFWSQMEGNKNGKLNTWAIFWYAQVFKNDGLCVNPSSSLIENIGHDGSGENCGVNESHKGVLSTKRDFYFIKSTVETKVAVDRIKQFFKSQKRNLFVRIINKISRIVIKRNILK